MFSLIYIVLKTFRYSYNIYNLGIYNLHTTFIQRNIYIPRHFLCFTIPDFTCNTYTNTNSYGVMVMSRCVNICLGLSDKYMYKVVEIQQLSSKYDLHYKLVSWGQLCFNDLYKTALQARFKISIDHLVRTYFRMLVLFLTFL